MVKDNRGNMKICRELLGLPGVGKTTTLASGNFITRRPLRHSLVNKGLAFDKFKNIAIGMRYGGMAVVPIMLKMLNRPHVIGQIKLILVLLDRLGRVKKFEGQDIVIDEGIMQAIWGFLWRTKTNKTMCKDACLIVEMLSRHVGIIYYIRCSKLTHIDRMKRRSDGDMAIDFFFDKMSYEKGRNAMAFLLRAIRNNQLEIKLIDRDLG